VFPLWWRMPRWPLARGVGCRHCVAMAALPLAFVSKARTPHGRKRSDCHHPSPRVPSPPISPVPGAELDGYRRCIDRPGSGSARSRRPSDATAALRRLEPSARWEARRCSRTPPSCTTRATRSRASPAIRPTRRRWLRWLSRPIRGDAERSDLLLAGIVYRLKTGCQWKALPSQFGSGSTCHLRFQQWCDAGVFERVHAELLRYYDKRRGIQWNWGSLDTGSGQPTLRTFAACGPLGPCWTSNSTV